MSITSFTSFNKYTYKGEGEGRGRREEGEGGKEEGGRGREVDYLLTGGILVLYSLST